MYDKKKVVLIVTLMVSLFLISAGVTYAYFAAQISQSENSGVSIQAVNGLEINFSNSNEILIDNALPGSYQEKDITVTLINKNKNFGQVYNMVLNIKNNTFDEGKGHLTYTITKENETLVNKKEITKSSGTELMLKNTRIEGTTNDERVSEVYHLKIEYPNQEYEQEQGGIFNGYISFKVVANPLEERYIVSDKDNTEVLKDNLEIGNMVVLSGGSLTKDERFYVYKVEKENGKTTKIYTLSEYNLDLYDITDEAGNILASPTSKPTNPTGMQTSTGRDVVFSNDQLHATNEECTKIGIGLDGGICRVGYIGSVPYYYVENYRNELESNGAGISEARLITKSEIDEVVSHYTTANTATYNTYLNNAESYPLKEGYTLDNFKWLWKNGFYGRFNLLRKRN